MIAPTTMIVPHFVGESRIEAIEKPVPEPGSGQLLLRVEANVLCGSERYQFKLGSPVTPGHEVVGSVTAVGPATATADSIAAWAKATRRPSVAGSGRKGAC